MNTLCQAHFYAFLAQVHKMNTVGSLMSETMKQIFMKSGIKNLLKVVR